MEPDILSKDEWNYVLNAIDLKVRQQGIAVAQMGLTIVAKLQASLQNGAIAPVADQEETETADTPK